MLCWGSAFGAALSAVESLQQKGKQVSLLHLQCLYPFHEELGNVLSSFDKILIPEMNLGQLSVLIRSEFLVDAVSMKKVQGKPFMVSEIRERIESLLQG